MRVSANTGLVANIVLVARQIHNLTNRDLHRFTTLRLTKPGRIGIDQEGRAVITQHRILHIICAPAAAAIDPMIQVITQLGALRALGIEHGETISFLRQLPPIKTANRVVSWRTAISAAGRRSVFAFFADFSGLLRILVAVGHAAAAAILLLAIGG